MKFTRFKISNFKGIEEVEIDLDKSPNAKIFTFVGLNESGKTTILEAINFFNPNNEGLKALGIEGSNISDFNQLIPINQRDNFNETISIEVEMKPESDDLKRINEFARENTSFKRVKPPTSIRYFRNYKFSDSKFDKLDSRWSGFSGWLKTAPSFTSAPISITSPDYTQDNLALAKFCRELIPSILYFPNFLFDFPSKIYLEVDGKPTEKEKFYIELIQDILYSLQNNSNVQNHLIDRAKSGDGNDRRNLDSMLQKMGRKVTEVVFGAWNRIFDRQLPGTRVIIKCELDEKDFPYLLFEIEADDGIYQINERSLGFRWFFVFLLFTQFRPFRQNSPKNIIFLFDEPASNLHSSAQKQLLKSFENLTQNSKIIYATHSHHLINPNWIESTYVVKNEGLQLETPEAYSIKKTDIKIESYRTFANKHPHNTAYFQPILDVLDYAPSNLEMIHDCVFFEGKNDFYSLAYFEQIILETPEDDTLNLAPSTGSGNLDTLISLYIGWGKNFIVLLDSDKAGQEQKQRYFNKFGKLVQDRIFVLGDIHAPWNGNKMEDLINEEERLDLQQISYPDSELYNKTHFNRAIQENLINQSPFSFSDETIQNFKRILDFLKAELHND